jgi:hypothetical protein
VALLPGVETVVRHNFGNSEDASSSEIISFEKIAKSDTSLAVVSVPDSAELSIDNSIKAFTPHKTSVIDEGDHTLLLKAQGYEDKTVRVKTHKGYKLTAIVTLAKLPLGLKVTPTPTPTPTIPSETVLISQTAIGYVRIRETPTTTGKEIGQATSGKPYPFIEQDKVTGWFKIEYEIGKMGWISNQFAKKETTKLSTTPTPKVDLSITPTP